MIPGEIIPCEGELELNVGSRIISVLVANTGDRPIQVGSHYHFLKQIWHCSLIALPHAVFALIFQQVPLFALSQVSNVKFN